MIIFFQELVLLLFLWFLRLIDGIMEIFSAISGIAEVNYHGQKVNLIEVVVGDSTVNIIFWCIFILAIGISFIFAIVAICKNMVTNQRNISTILGKFFISILGLLIMVCVVILGILISNAILKLISEIFQIENTTKLSNALFNTCVGEWSNGYSIKEIDVTSLSVGDIFGDYQTTFKVFPKSWKNNGMVNPNQFLYLPAMISSISLVIALVVAIINLAKRVYELVLLYLVMPLSMSTLCLDDGARFKVWRETFITKVVLAYGNVFSVNIFVLILPMIAQMKIEGISNFGNSMFVLFMIIGGAMIIPTGQTLFARLFGSADDMRVGGGFWHSAFYGTRFVSMATLGVTSKMIRGAIGIGRRNKAKQDHKKKEENKKYTEEKETEEKKGENDEK